MKEKKDELEKEEAKNKLLEVKPGGKEKGTLIRLKKEKNELLDFGRIEVIVRSFVSGEVDYVDGMPRELTLVRKLLNGKEYTARYEIKREEISGGDRCEEVKVSELARQKAVQAWCTPETEGIVMDLELAKAFARIIDKIWSLPWLGNATTKELLNEIAARIEMDGKLDYRTVDEPNVFGEDGYKKGEENERRAE